ncbi:MAG: hypothetical protein AAFO86_09005 [Pseudomonadota bacterium]
MARDTYIIRPTSVARPVQPKLSRDEKINHFARYVLRDVARRIDARTAKTPYEQA